MTSDETFANLKIFSRNISKKLWGCPTGRKTKSHKNKKEQFLNEASKTLYNIHSKQAKKCVKETKKLLNELEKLNINVNHTS